MDVRAAALSRLADTIRSCRRERQMSQEDVAFNSGVSLRHLQSLESGLLNPSYMTLLKIAEALDSRLSDIIEKAA